MTSEETAAIERLRALSARIGYALLTTRALDGSLVSRPLQALQVDAEGVIWFFTSNASEKIAEIGCDPRVDVAYADPERKRFASISGTAQMVLDRGKIDELWSLAQTIFFPLGREDPSLVLLRVTPVSARYWDGNESPLGLLMKFGKAVLRHEASDLGTRTQLHFDNG